MICALIGDQTIRNLNEERLELRLRTLIEQEHVSAFVLGYFGPFEQLALRVIRRLQQDYPLLDYTVILCGLRKERPAEPELDYLHTLYPQGCWLWPGRIGLTQKLCYLASASDMIAYWHMAHSFVRGNWSRSEDSCPMILAKCCHDTDILTWLAGSSCAAVSSFGSLSHFNAAHKPDGATEYCLDGCMHRDRCPYYAPRFYLEHPKAVSDGFVSVVSLDPSREAVLNALQRGPYGRCVYQCDNNVVDNQVVNLLYENGVSVSMTMCAFTEHCERIINVMGSCGQIRGNMESSTLEINDFASGNHTTLHVHTPAGGHSGSDAAMMRDFLQTLHCGGGSKTSADASVESHLIALAAEESRLRGGEAIDMKEWRTNE